MATRPEAETGSGGRARAGARTGTGRDPVARLVAATATLVERIGEHERRHRNEEHASHDFQNAHMHLLAALQYGGDLWPFKPRRSRGTSRGTILGTKHLT